MVTSLTDKVRFVESVFGRGRISRDSRNFDVRCPICAPTDKTKLKLSVLTEESADRALACHCWVCGYRSRSLWNLILRYGDKQQLFEFRDRFLPKDKHDCSWFLIDDATVAPQKLALPKDFKLLVTEPIRDPDVLAMRSYLVKRNVSERDMWFYKLGCSSNEPKWRRRIIVPSFDAQGELNHYVGRTIDKYQRPKYETPDGERKHVIFNELNIDWDSRLVVCEGTFDLMKCGENAVPLLGSDLNEQSALFNAIIAHRTPVALALDADMRVTKLPRLHKKLATFDIDVIVVTVPTDPGDMTKQEFRAALEAAQPLDWKQTFFDRLEVASRTVL